MNFSTRPRRRSNAVVMAAALATLTTGMMAASTGANAASAFDALKGGWSGGGTAHFAGGESEKLRCTARYSGGGSNLSLNLKCASSSAQINLAGQLSASGNKVSGSWNESSYGQSGEAYGSTSGGSVRLRISAPSPAT
jgi:hypothetical protein